MTTQLADAAVLATIQARTVADRVTHLPPETTREANERNHHPATAHRAEIKLTARPPNEARPRKSERRVREKRNSASAGILRPPTSRVVVTTARTKSNRPEAATEAARHRLRVLR
jgi:hypothetical protein